MFDKCLTHMFNIVSPPKKNIWIFGAPKKTTAGPSARKLSAVPRRAPGSPPWRSPGPGDSAGPPGPRWRRWGRWSHRDDPPGGPGDDLGSPEMMGKWWGNGKWWLGLVGYIRWEFLWGAKVKNWKNQRSATWQGWMLLRSWCMFWMGESKQNL